MPANDQSTLDASVFQNVTKSVDSLRTTLSITGINVPRFDTFNDVFEFLAEYELITTGLDESQKILMLAKAFPVKCHRAFYEAELAPLVKRPKPWSEVKNVIVDRFADTNVQARHLVRLRELKFDPESDKSLLDFVEEVFHSYKKAYPEEVVKTTAVAHVKASIPKELRQAFNMHSDFREAKDEESLKHYDLSKGVSNKQIIGREEAKDITAMVQETLKTFQKQVIDSQKAVVAALRIQEEKIDHVSRSRYRSPEHGPQRSQSPGFSRELSRNASPSRESRNEYERVGYRAENGQRPRGYYNGNNFGRRSPSPRVREFNNQNFRSIAERPPTPHHNLQTADSTQLADSIYDSKRYLKEYGKPPRPCSHCGSNHWDRHFPLRSI